MWNESRGLPSLHPGREAQTESWTRAMGHLQTDPGRSFQSMEIKSQQTGDPHGKSLPPDVKPHTWRRGRKRRLGSFLMADEKAG